MATVLVRASVAPVLDTWPTCAGKLYTFGDNGSGQVGHNLKVGTPVGEAIAIIQRAVW